MKNFLSRKICLTLVIIQKIQSFLVDKMKDKFGGVIANEFAGLKSKMYSITKVDAKEFNIAKGVSIAAEFNKFEDVLFNKKVIRHKMRRIQSKKHKSGTYEIAKIPFSYFDNKRYMLDVGISTLSYFYKK